MKGVAFLDAISNRALWGVVGIKALPLYTTPTNIIIIPYLKFARKGIPYCWGYVYIFVTD
jgi:hypothetical protein